MEFHNAFTYPWFGILWRRTGLPENFVVETLCSVAVRFPPTAYSVHVMCRSGAYRAIGIGPCIAEGSARVLGHTLYLKFKNLKIVHHGRHAGGNHAKVLGAYKHVGSVDERRQFPHSLSIPEVIVATIEEVVIHPVEAPALVVIQCPVGIGELRRDTRMVFAFFIWVLDEKHLIYQAEESIAYAVVTVIVLLM